MLAINFWQLRKRYYIVNFYFNKLTITNYIYKLVWTVVCHDQMNVHHFEAASRTGEIVALGICAICPTIFLSLTLWLCILLCYHHHKTLWLLLSSSPCLPLAASGWMAAFSLAAASLSCICFSMYCSISGHVSSVAFQRFKHRSVVVFPLFPFPTGPKYLLISSSMKKSHHWALPGAAVHVQQCIHYQELVCGSQQL